MRLTLVRGTRKNATCRDMRLLLRERAIDAASLQGVADLKAFRLVREGPDAQGVKRAETADFNPFDVVADAADFAQTDPEPDVSELWTDIVI